MTRQDKQRRIRQAYEYNADMRRVASCNSFYMGSAATCVMFHHLGGGWPNVSLDDALARATDAQLDTALEYVQPYLKHVK